MDSGVYLDHIESLIEQHGRAVQFVAPDPETGSIGFSYTVGLFVHGLPEFIVFGLPMGLGHALLNDMAAAVLRSGVRFAPGDRVHRLLRGASALLLEVSDSTQHLYIAHDIRDRRGVESSVHALQLVLPDRNGLWPWDPESEESFIPILGPRVSAHRDIELPHDPEGN